MSYSLDVSHPLLDSISGATGSLELLQDQHQQIRKSLLSQSQQTEEDLRPRISEVKRTLDRLDLGVNEGRLVLTIINYLDTLETDQAQAGLQLVKIKDENDWLREELEEAERRLEDVLANIAGLEVEQEQHLLMQEARQLEQEADTKPVVASKIPVGSFRVEEERRINRALSRERSSGGMLGGGRIVRERSMSRIPVFSTNSPSNNLQEVGERKSRSMQLCNGSRLRPRISPTASCFNISAVR